MRSRLALLLLLAALLLAFGPGLAGTWQFDDFNVIVDNPAVHGLRAWTSSPGRIRPLLALSYAANWSLDPRPAGFLVVNLALHVLNAGLAFALMRRVCAASGLEGAAAARLAFSAALLWALHPVHTEAVSYVCGRSVSLSATFVLASLLAFLRSREAPGTAWRAASWLAFVAAVLARETALVLPAAVVLLAAVTAASDGPAGWLKAALPHGLLGLLLGAGLLLHPGHGHQLAADSAHRAPLDNLLAQTGAWAYLARAWAWPARLNLDPGLLPPAAWSPGAALVFAAACALPLVGLLALRRAPLLGLGLLWTVLFLLPTNSVLARLDVVNERQLYLPGLGLAVVAALGAFQAVRRLRLPAPVLPALLLVPALALGLRTARRTLDYRSETAMWTSSVAANPLNPRAHNNLGWARWLAGDREGAAAAFREALRLDPGYATARANLAALGAE
ncbi:MAG: tetratricopeptide repeat protein [Holophagaceae bacterium]